MLRHLPRAAAARPALALYLIAIAALGWKWLFAARRRLRERGLERRVLGGQLVLSDQYAWVAAGFRRFSLPSRFERAFATGDRRGRGVPPAAGVAGAGCPDLRLALAVAQPQAATPLDTWSGMAGLGIDGLAQDIEHFRHVWVMIGVGRRRPAGAAFG